MSKLTFRRRRKNEVNKTILKSAISWIFQIIVIVFLAAVTVYFVGMRTNVVGQSMSPTLNSGSSILINRFVYKLVSPKPNDLIVFQPNGNEKSHYYIKRVVAVAGDRVQIKNGIVYVNGKEFIEEIQATPIENPELASEELLLGVDEFFVLGDSRNNSEDSRYANIGNVHKDDIIGKAWFVVSPKDQFGFIK